MKDRYFYPLLVMIVIIFVSIIFVIVVLFLLVYVYLITVTSLTLTLNENWRVKISCSFSSQECVIILDEIKNDNNNCFDKFQRSSDNDSKYAKIQAQKM